MQDSLDIVKNIEMVYDSDTSFQVLKDFERVLDSLDLYVYKNWEDGELVEGPKIDRHWVTCSFMWPRDKMPDPMGAKRLVDYNCKIGYGKDYIVVPRKIKTPDDIRPGTKKGKLDRNPIWIVEIMMPKSLIGEIYSGSFDTEEAMTDPTAEPNATPDAQPADNLGGAAPLAPLTPAPAAPGDEAEPAGGAL